MSDVLKSSPENTDSISEPIASKPGHRFRDAGVTWIAVLLGLILIPIDNLWITVIEVRWYALDGTCLPLFITPIFMLFVICMANLAVRRLLPRLALSRGELLTILYHDRDRRLPRIA